MKSRDPTEMGRAFLWPGVIIAAVIALHVAVDWLADLCPLTFAAALAFVIGTRCWAVRHIESAECSLRAVIIDPRVTALPVASPLSNGPADATGENHQRCPLAARDSSQRAAKRPMLSALAVRPAPTSGLAARRLAHAAVVAGGPPDGVPASAAPRCLGPQVQPNVAPRGLLGRGLASAAWLRPVPECAPTAPAARRAASRQHALERARAAPAPPVACRPCVPERAVGPALVPWSPLWPGHALLVGSSQAGSSSPDFCQPRLDQYAPARVCSRPGRSVPRSCLAVPSALPFPGLPPAGSSRPVLFPNGWSRPAPSQAEPISPQRGQTELSSLTACLAE
jgi:hypothetical protein